MLAAKKQPLISARADFLVICIYYSAVKRTTLVGNGNCQKNTSFLCYISGYKFCSSTSELLQTQPWTQFLCSCKKHISNYYSSKHCLISWVPFAESPVPHLGLNPFPAHFFSATPLWNLSKVLSAPFTLSWTKRGGGNQFSLYQSAACSSRNRISEVSPGKATRILATGSKFILIKTKLPCSGHIREHTKDKIKCGCCDK